MPAALSDTLPGRPALRRLVYAVGLVALFGYLFEFTWPQTVVVAGIVLVGESVEIGRVVPVGDERHARFALGIVVLATGGYVFWRGPGTAVAALVTTVGGWLALDAFYSLRTGHRYATDREDPDASEAILSMHVGHLVAEELEDGPRTVPELADACDMTESRVRDALTLHERAGTAYREGDRWVLDESRIGPRAFVRDTTKRIVARLLRPFRLFVPS